MAWAFLIQFGRPNPDGVEWFDRAVLTLSLVHLLTGALMLAGAIRLGRPRRAEETPEGVLHEIFR